MKNLSVLWKGCAVLLVLASLAGCTSSSGLKPLEDPDDALQESYAATYKGPRSPASAYCVQMGGSLRNTPQGKNALCHFPDGHEEDTWELFWRDNPKN